MYKIKCLLLLVVVISGCDLSKTKKCAMDNKDKQMIIENFIRAYNSFDTHGMLKDLHREVIFENISGGQVNLTTKGIEELREQAGQTNTYFKERQSRVIEMHFRGDQVEVNIDYYGVLAKDLPDGLKAGDTLRIKGRSLYQFKGNKIISIRDISE
jgi:hypothetical protein